MIDAETGWYFMHVSVKVVVIVEGKVLLGMNPRGDWELLGGWPDRDDSTLQETAQREVKEESGIELESLELIDARLLRDPKVGSVVAIVAYGSNAAGIELDGLLASDEHRSLRLFTRREVQESDRILPDYKELIESFLSG